MTEPGFFERMAYTAIGVLIGMVLCWLTGWG